jgi:hypothetical protein
MDKVLVLLILGSLIAIIIGLVKPGLVIKWGEKRTRPRVLVFYGGLFIILFIALGMTGTSNSEKDSSHGNKSSAAAVDENSKKDVNLNADEAKTRLQTWVDTHKFLSSVSITAKDGKRKFDGFESECYTFALVGLSRTQLILVDPANGGLFIDDGKIMPLEEWYQKYIAPHNDTNTDKGNKNTGNYINKKFEWVEKPSIKNGYIVGKIKNISNREQFPTITFALYDSQGNQIGTASDSLMSLKDGNTWSFKASVNNPRVTDYEFSGID